MLALVNTPQGREPAELRDVHQGGHDSPHSEASGEGRVNLAKQALRLVFINLA